MTELLQETIAAITDNAAAREEVLSSLRVVADGGACALFSADKTAVAAVVNEQSELLRQRVETCIEIARASQERVSLVTRRQARISCYDGNSGGALQDIEYHLKLAAKFFCAATATLDSPDIELPNADSMRSATQKIFDESNRLCQGIPSVMLNGDPGERFFKNYPEFSDPEEAFTQSNTELAHLLTGLSRNYIDLSDCLVRLMSLHNAYMMQAGQTTDTQVDRETFVDDIASQILCAEECEKLAAHHLRFLPAPV